MHWCVTHPSSRICVSLCRIWSHRSALLFPGRLGDHFGKGVASLFRVFGRALVVMFCLSCVQIVQSRTKRVRSLTHTHTGQDRQDTFTHWRHGQISKEGWNRGVLLLVIFVLWIVRCMCVRVCTRQWNVNRQQRVNFHIWCVCACHSYINVYIWYVLVCTRLHTHSLNYSHPTFPTGLALLPWPRLFRRRKLHVSWCFMTRGHWIAWV